MTPLPPGGHVLPPLPYPYNALEPVLDAKTVELHHDRHHKKYVEDLNATELALVKAREEKDWHLVSYLEERLAFTGSGHILHSVYWTNMTRAGTGGQPGKHTLSYLDWYYGGLAPFLAQFSAVAGRIQGSGWAVLGFQPAWCRLELLQCEGNQNCVLQGTVPILVCDVWEHAYYLQYQNDRAGYISRWWELVNWPDVEARFLQATRGRLPLEMGDGR